MHQAVPAQDTPVQHHEVNCPALFLSLAQLPRGERIAIRSPADGDRWEIVQLDKHVGEVSQCTNEGYQSVRGVAAYFNARRNINLIEINDFKLSHHLIEARALTDKEREVMKGECFAARDPYLAAHYHAEIRPYHSRYYGDDTASDSKKSAARTIRPLTRSRAPRKFLMEPHGAQATPEAATLTAQPRFEQASFDLNVPFQARPVNENVPSDYRRTYLRTHSRQMKLRL